MPAIRLPHGCRNCSQVVDDCLTDSKSALLLQRELTEMFARGGFVLRKWNSNDRSILKQIPEDPREVQAFPEADEYSNALGIDVTDQFRIAFAKTPSNNKMTKRSIVSDVASMLWVSSLLSGDNQDENSPSTTVGDQNGLG